MNKRDRKALLSIVPSLTAPHQSYKGYHIARYTDEVGSRYNVTTLTGKHVATLRSLKLTRQLIDGLA